MNTAHLTIAASDNITLTNCNVSGGDGVNWAFVNDSIISANIAFSNNEGIFLYRSFNNKIINNRILNNTKTGISLSRSSDNIIKQNILELANWGIHLCESSENNVILCNNISTNNVGLRLICCPPPSKNQIYHNNFVNNLESACAIMCLDNKWDNGYPSGGNYWSDYEEKYPDAKEIDESGIWDIPYDISGGAKDNYPLMEPWGEKQGLPDLTFSYGGIFSPDGISIYPDELLVGDPVNIEVLWENNGEGWCEDDFDVIFYLGDPDVDNDGVIDDNANVIGSDHVDGLGLFPPDEGDLVVLKWAPSEFGTFDIYVVVDPEVDTSDSKIGAVVESDEDDNEVHTSVVVRPAIYGFVNVDTVPRTHVAGIPVYLYQEGKGNIGDVITDTDGFYKFKLSEEIDPTTDKFYVLAKWENDAVRIRDCTGAPIGAEVIRARWPPKGLLNEDTYMEIPLDGLWPEILFDDDDAFSDYEDAKNIFEAINEAYNYVMDEKYYPIDGDNKPGMVDVYIHDPMVPCPQTHPFPGGGSIHFPLDHKHGYYSKGTAYHEYGHAIHYQHGAGLGYNAKMAEGWAIYFQSLPEGGSGWRPLLEQNEGYCFEKYDKAEHKWGLVYARIFHDLYDGVDNSDSDDYENGEKQIWNTFMEDKVTSIDEFYEKFVERTNERDSINTIYATHGLISPVYEGELNGIVIPTDPLIIQRDTKVPYEVSATNTGEHSLNYEIQFYVSNGQFSIDFYGRDTDELTGVLPGQESETVSWIWNASAPMGLYETGIYLTPRDYCSTYLGVPCHQRDWVDSIRRTVLILDVGGFAILSDCPVDLIVVDPNDLVINKESNDIPEATYTEVDINGDSDPDDIVLIPDRKIGDYQITVIPEPDAEPSDTYTLTVSAGGTTTVLAENVSVSEIPAEPYIFNSDMNQRPRAFFSFSPENPVVNQVIKFNASSSVGSITNYEWDFGDGSYGTGKIITHSYSNPGIYSVTLTVEDNEGNTDVNAQIVEVKDISPTRDIPISTAANSQLRPTIAYNPANNEYLVTWDDKRSGNEREIYAQRLSGANSLVGSNFAIALSSGTDIDEVNPFVVYNPTANEYLVVWNEKSGYHNLYYIYAQRVSNTGSLVGDKITVSSGGVRVRKLHPTVAYNPANNEYLIVWYGQHVEGQSYRIYGQRLSNSGSLLASNFAIGEDIGKDNWKGSIHREPFHLTNKGSIHRELFLI